MRRKAAEEITARDKSRMAELEQGIRDARGVCAVKNAGGAVAKPGGDDCAAPSVASGAEIMSCGVVRPRSYTAVLCQPSCNETKRSGRDESVAVVDELPTCKRCGRKGHAHPDCVVKTEAALWTWTGRRRERGRRAMKRVAGEDAQAGMRSKTVQARVRSAVAEATGSEAQIQASCCAVGATAGPLCEAKRGAGGTTL